MTDRRRRAERKGRIAETVAALYLRLLGFSIVAMRFRAAGGEVDVIARRGRLLVFAEVKARRTVGDALFAVTDANARRVSAATGAFLARHRRFADFDMRYDIIAIAPWRLTHERGAWRDDA
ncbi:MAG: YraN family protein [Pseudomonadota bacterium]